MPKVETSANSSPEILSKPIQFVKGIGPQRAEVLGRLGLFTVRDILFYFPRDYEDLSRLRSIAELSEGETASVCGTIEETDCRNTGLGRSIAAILIRQDDQYLRCLWFNQAYLQNKFRVGQRILVAGQPRRAGFRWEMLHPQTTPLANDETPPRGEILPIYPLTAGINQPQMRRIIRSVVETHAKVLEEVFPEDFLEQHQLSPIHVALPQIHAPTDGLSLDQARRRFIYQELLVMQLALAIRRAKLRGDRRAPKLTCDSRIDSRIRRLFPFELTSDQNQSLKEICADLANEVPMNRLLQGDVGTGKTVVAEYAMLLTVAHGYQAVLMAPTEVLARQHARTLTKNLDQSRVRIALLVGSLTATLRRETLNMIAEGQIDLVVGTHSILQEDVQFAKLGLVIIDEQHKFGVLQRAKLKYSGLDPHYLVMTATPIPRTVSMTIFGDLDTSVLRSPPPGRQTIQTYVSDGSQREQWWEFFRKKLREGRQGFVITPLVDESESVSAASVAQAFETLSNGELEAFRLGLVHGRQSAIEKDAAMEAFRSGETQVLVATSVVEVGVDIPNATVMTIENAERFGLAQLHQLRGRISRGVHPGYLCIFSASDVAETRQRLQSFAATTDGFALAELDFRLRGPGDLFSVKQHGLPPLRVADVLRDAEVLEEARRDAHALTAEDLELEQPKYAKLKRMVLVRYGQALDLGAVG